MRRQTKAVRRGNAWNAKGGGKKKKKIIRLCARGREREREREME